jgi:hypothetical protein
MAVARRGTHRSPPTTHHHTTRCCGRSCSLGPDSRTLLPPAAVQLPRSDPWVVGCLWCPSWRSRGLRSAQRLLVAPPPPFHTPCLCRSTRCRCNPQTVMRMLPAHPAVCPPPCTQRSSWHGPYCSWGGVALDPSAAPAPSRFARFRYSTTLAAIHPTRAQHATRCAVRGASHWDGKSYLRHDPQRPRVQDTHAHRRHTNNTSTLCTQHTTQTRPHQQEPPGDPHPPGAQNNTLLEAHQCDSNKGECRPSRSVGRLPGEGRRGRRRAGQGT